MGYEYDIIAGVIFLTIILLMTVVIIIEKLFPKSKISKKLEKLAYWIRDSIAI